MRRMPRVASPDIDAVEIAEGCDGELKVQSIASIESYVLNGRSRR